MKIDVYTDGSATVATKPGGYGYVIVIDGVKHSEGSGAMPLASNNDAELEAAIQGLKAVLMLRIKDPAKYGQNTDVTLVSDSEIVLGWANGTYRFKQKNKMEKYQALKSLVSRLYVGTRWVEGHTGDEHNERCDELANIARKDYIRRSNVIENEKLVIEEMNKPPTLDGLPKKRAKKEKKFRWNNDRMHVNPDVAAAGDKYGNIVSDKSIIQNPETRHFAVVLGAACRVLSELIELQEKKK